jgi:crotonobetainyl-CoA:carnitine CoA-transferase CaiB-like acyl-CoA transferase
LPFPRPLQSLVRFTVLDLAHVRSGPTCVRQLAAPQDRARRAECREPSHPSGRLPEFGEQTDEVLTEFGFTADEIGALRRDKVV